MRERERVFFHSTERIFVRWCEKREEKLAKQRAQSNGESVRGPCGKPSSSVFLGGAGSSGKQVVNNKSALSGKIFAFTTYARGNEDFLSARLLSL